MSDALDQARELLQQQRDARASGFVDRRKTPRDGSAPTMQTFVAGDAVFDAATGLDGVIATAPTLTASPGALYGVRLPDGTIALRRGVDLIRRPARVGG
jgi:hypothetical protein